MLIRFRTGTALAALTACAIATAGVQGAGAAQAVEAGTTTTTATTAATSTATTTSVKVAPSARFIGPRSRLSRKPKPKPTATAPTRTLVWSDEFAGAAGTAPDPRNWTHEVGGHGWGNDEVQTYTDRTENVSLDGQGALRITARHETYTGKDGRTRDWTSGRLFTKDLREFQYGRMEARMKVPAGQGLWPAFWMLGHDNWDVGWPESGEIDVMETFNAGLDVYTTVHGPSTANAAGKYFVGTWTPSPVSYADAYHLYAVDWSATEIRFSIDGKVVKTVRPADVPAGGRWVYDKPYYLLLNLAVGGWPGPPDATTPRQASLLVDWVRVYR